MTTLHLSKPRCATTGYHTADLIEGAPQDLGTCINIEHRCPDCGKVVIVTSWRKDLLEQEQKQRRGDS